MNCAGNATYRRFLDTPAAEFQHVTDVTYQGTVNGTRAALRRMLPRDSGHIVGFGTSTAGVGIGQVLFIGPGEQEVLHRPEQRDKARERRNKAREGTS